MEINNIDTFGITTQETLKSYKLKHPRNEICETFKVSFSQNIPEVKTILQVFFDTKVIQINTIYSQGKTKLFLHGIIAIKMAYAINDSLKQIDNIEFSKHLSCLLPTNNEKTKNLSAKIFIEDAIITQENNKDFYISLLLLICPINNKDIDKYNDVEIIPNNAKLNKTIKPNPTASTENKTIESKPTIPIENNNSNSNINVEIEYDMKKQ